MLLDPAYLLTVLLVFVRIGGVLVAAPPFHRQQVPVMLKVLLAVLLAYALAGFVRGPLPAGIDQPGGFVIAVAAEALTGLLIGFAARFVFFAVEIAGDIIGYQMSLSLAQVFSPDGESSNPLGRLFSMAFLILFLVLDGPQQILSALALSFDAVPLAGADFVAAGPMLLDGAATLFMSAIRLAAPFMVAMLLVDVSLSMFARVVPQADFFSLGLPLKLLAGTILAALYVEAFGPVAVELVRSVEGDLLRLIEAIAG